MGQFDPTQGAVTAKVTESGPYFEIVHAVQGGKSVGAIRFDWTRNGVLLETVASSHGHAEFAPLILKRFDAALALSKRTTQFIDFWDISTYDSAFRIEHTQWGQRHRGAIDGIHILTRSKLVSMGVSVANMALGGFFTSYTNRAEFDIAATKMGLPSRRPIPGL